MAEVDYPRESLIGADTPSPLSSRLSAGLFSSGRHAQRGVHHDVCDRHILKPLRRTESPCLLGALIAAWSLISSPPPRNPERAAKLYLLPVEVDWLLFSSIIHIYPSVVHVE